MELKTNGERNCEQEMTVSRKMTPGEHLKLQQLYILEWYEEQKHINKIAKI